MAPKKVDVRRFMREKKGHADTAKKINSPLARYSSSGQLVCVLCNAPVKNELLWTAHVHGKKHKENLCQLKNKSNPPGASETEGSLKTISKNPVNSSCDPTFFKPPVERYEKRRAEHTSAEHGELPLKKAKVTKDCGVPGIPRNLQDDVFAKPVKGQPVSPDGSKLTASSSPNDTKKHIPPKATSDSASGLPADFFDGSTTQDMPNSQEPNSSSKTSSSDALPEGFFDDPKLDAKVRNVEYKDPVEQEWEKFQREMQMENQVSEAIVEEEDEEATFDRELMELSEQRLYYLRADALRDKQALVQVEMKKRASERQKQLAHQEDDDSGSDEFEDLLDWRAKKVS